MDEIPNDEIIVHEAHIFHHAELVVEAIPCLLPGVGHLLGHAFLAQLSEIGTIVHAVRRHELWQTALSEFYLHVAFIHDLHGVAEGLFLPRKELQQFLGGLAVEFLRAHAHPILLVHEPLGLDTQQHVLGLGILLVRVVDIVSSHGLYSQLISQLLQFGQHHLLLPNAVVLKLDIEVLPEHAFEPLCQSVSLLIPIMQQMLRDIAADTGGHADQSLTVLREQIIVDAGPIIEPMDKSLRRKPHQVLIAGLILRQQDEMAILPVQLPLLDSVATGRHIGLHAYDRLDPLLLAFPIKIDDAVHDPVIRDSHGGLAQGFGSRHQGRDAGRSIQQRVLGMDMQMRKGNRHREPPQVI